MEVEYEFIKFQGFTYTFDNGDVIIWNADEAEKLLSAGGHRETIPVDREQMEVLMARCEWDAKHVETANPDQPGIGAPVKLVDPKDIREAGGRDVIYIIIDGIHRCVRAYMEQRPFHVRLLTDAASRACVVHCTNLNRLP